MIKPANIECPDCKWMALADDEKKIIFCQNSACMVDGKYKQIKPKYDMYIPK